MVFRQGKGKQFFRRRVMKVSFSPYVAKKISQASFSNYGCIECLYRTKQFLLGGYGEGDTPDPIPNSEVKALIADGTTRKSVEE